MNNKLGKMKLTTICLTLSICLLLVSGSFAQHKTTHRQIMVEGTEEVKKIADIENDASAFKINLKVNQANATYKVGDTMVVSFTTTKNCHLTLFNVDAQGKTQIIFPNKYQTDDFVKAGETYSIPAEGAKFVFRAQAPAGTELLKAIATLEAVELVKKSDVKPQGAFQQFVQRQSFVAEGIDHALDKVDEKRWAETELTVTVVE